MNALTPEQIEAIIASIHHTDSVSVVRFDPPGAGGGYCSLSYDELHERLSEIGRQSVDAQPEAVNQ
jgi:hypothetical protein